MLRIVSSVLAITVFSCTTTTQPEESMNDKPSYVLVIHGGAGTIKRAEMPADLEAQYLAALNAALGAGEKILKDGGTSLDAVQQAVMLMEDSPLFNAGKGAVFTHEGT